MAAKLWQQNLQSRSRVKRQPLPAALLIHSGTPVLGMARPVFRLGIRRQVNVSGSGWVP